MLVKILPDTSGQFRKASAVAVTSIDLTGQKFGRLTVLRRDGDKRVGSANTRSVSLPVRLWQRSPRCGKAFKGREHQKLRLLSSRNETRTQARTRCTCARQSCRRVS